MIHSFLGPERGSKPSSVTQAAPHKPQCHRWGLCLAEVCSFPPLLVISRLSGKCLKCRFANPGPPNKLVSTSFTQRRKLGGGTQDLHGWLMGLRSPESLSTQHKSSFGSCGVQKAQEEGGDQARLRPNSLPRFLCPNKSFIY